MEKLALISILPTREFLETALGKLSTKTPNTQEF